MEMHVRTGRWVNLISVVGCALLWTAVMLAMNVLGMNVWMEFGLSTGTMGWVALLMGLTWVKMFLVVFVVLHWLLLKRVLGARGVWLWLVWPLIGMVVGGVTFAGCEMVITLLNREDLLHGPRMAVWYYGVRTLQEYGYLSVRAMGMTYPLTLVTVFLVRRWYGRRDGR